MALRGSSFSPPQASSVGPSEVVDGQASTALNQYHDQDRSIRDSYLKGAPQSENTVVSLFRRQSFQCQHNRIGLFGNQIIGPVDIHALTKASTVTPHNQVLGLPGHHFSLNPYWYGVILPQSELPIPCGIGVPLRQWSHPSLQPGTFDDVVGQ